MSEFYKLSYGDILRELRNYQGFKQKDISDYLNITSQAYSNYENNKRTPDADTLYKIAQFYNITVDQLLSYRYTRQLEDFGSYTAPKTLFHGVSEGGISISLNGKQAKMVTDILALSPEQQDVCQQFIEFMKKTTS